MLKSLSVKNFTLFPEAHFEFSPGLNVLIGENGTGKSHLLKLAYAIGHIWYHADHHFGQRQIAVEGLDHWWPRRLTEKLLMVLKPETLFHLCPQPYSPPCHLQVTATLNNEPPSVCQFSIHAENDLEMTKEGVQMSTPPSGLFPQEPVFMSAKEALTLYPGLIPLYEKFDLPVDETFYDLCKSLSTPLLRNTQVLDPLVKPLETLLGGYLKLEFNRFYLITKHGKMEISLVAEGLRKLGQLSYLIKNDSIRQDSMLFWDEPEANLNPKLMKQVASSLVNLAAGGTQILVATHSLFLMEELSLLMKIAKPIPARFFSLTKEQDRVVVVEQGKTLTDLHTITALDEELDLYDRKHEAFYATKGANV